MTTIPAWVAELEDEDLVFVKKFLLASGSLKEVASLYGVSYPTVRLRLDRLIQKIQLAETAEADPYVSLVKHLAIDDKLDLDTAKLLLAEYRKTKEIRMRNVSITLWLLLLFQLFLLIGAVLLQRYLSKRESRWPGLVLPGMTFLYALAMALSATVSDGGFPGDRPWPPSCCATSPP